jgi:hypothetical protein
MASRQADAEVAVVLRLRVCLRCHVMFYICRRCDRGQRYCSPPCRVSALREQRRQANRRHQQTVAGRQDHRDRQRSYRKRCAQRRWACRGVIVPEPGADLAQDSCAPCPRRPTALSLENVTDKSSAALISSRMISAGDSGSPTAVDRAGCAAPVLVAGLFAKPRGRGHGRANSPLLLRCVVCGCRSCFVDPFPHPRR